MVLAAMMSVPAMTSSASAVPMKKCQPGAENFQIVNGVCVSDGKAEKLNG